MPAEISPTNISRPYRISVDADIPVGATVRVVCEGTMPGGAPWREEYTNPSLAPFDQARCELFQPFLFRAPDNVSAPLLYSIVVEGDGKRQTFPAEEFAGGADMAEYVFVRPSEGRPFLTLKNPLLPFADISLSDAEHPLTFEIIGHAPRDSSIVFGLSFTAQDGSVSRQEFVGPCREAIDQELMSSYESARIDFSLAASSDGFATPNLSGIAIEGGRRRYFLSAARIVDALGDRVLESFKIWNFSNTEAVLTLKAIPPKFDGPPTILNRLHNLFQEGKLKVEGFDS